MCTAVHHTQHQPSLIFVNWITFYGANVIWFSLWCPPAALPQLSVIYGVSWKQPVTAALFSHKLSPLADSARSTAGECRCLRRCHSSGFAPPGGGGFQNRQRNQSRASGQWRRTQQTVTEEQEILEGLPNYTEFLHNVALDEQDNYFGYSIGGTGGLPGYPFLQTVWM